MWHYRSLVVLCAVLAVASCKSGSDTSPDGATAADMGGQDQAVAEVPGDAVPDLAKDLANDQSADVAADRNPDRTPDGFSDGVPVDRGPDSLRDTGAATLADCFKDAPAPVNDYQSVIKRSTDGKITVRMVLDTEDRLGTSGTHPWNLVRFGIDQNGLVTCVRDRSKLDYQAVHHNCGDTATVDAGGVRYEMQAPDRATTRISASMGANKLWGPVMLTNVSCTPESGSTACHSGGPC